MPVRRLSAAASLTAAATLAVPAAPVFAHGAPTTPISRSAACAGNGTRTGTAACEAAKAATNGFLGAYDNLRIAGVGGDDRAAVPDGKLCSGGLDAYRGLDLPRDDFPSTAVRSGQRLAIAYRGTIPHAGEFRIYLTRPGYDASKRLTWADLGSKPLASFTDPPLTGGAYRMRVTLPPRTGRQMLYVVWETSSTPDTYYSCSDLVFPAAPVVSRAPSAAPAPTAATGTAATGTAVPVRTSAVRRTSPGAAGAAAATAPPRDAGPVPVAATGPDGGSPAVGHWLIAGALGGAALAAAIGLAGRLRHRRRRAGS
ncbi:lytic polysaccharide monooxygenase [Actinoplanes teichomyceticus]|uniref:lytic polysaccharide monooxygenase n=1 Tax=Actinoplanes teichomyceticus TaxID=1867 RepID=UPI000F0A49D9|nr:lytic polysaccharide monooxygenase [Actinoplanes teichomyceticus]